MIRYQKDTEHIATLTLDMTGRNVNILNHEITDAFEPVLAHLEKEKKANKLKGIIITSSKSSFLAGGDIDYIFNEKNPEALFDYSRKLQQLFRRIESPGVPVAAAINGTALATGFELALACHYRVVIDKPTTRVGFPEISVGLMPSNGGCIRMMWLLGIQKALEVLTTGKRLRPKEAFNVGIVDELATDEKAQPEGRRPWDTVNCQIPHQKSDLENRMLIGQLTAEITRKYQNNYPAPKAILNTLVEGSKLDFDTACRVESRHFTQLVGSPEAHNMAHALWHNFNEIKEGKRRPKGFGKFRPKKIGIIGAGQMGSGIAISCLLNGLKVVLKDVSMAIAARAEVYCTKHLNHLVEVGTISDSECKNYLKRIKVTDNSADFEDCDLVIEAVFENKNVKVKVTKEAEAHLDEYAFFATNTVSIPITTLQKAATRPENYIGLHFFKPAESVQVVEIIKGDHTSDETIARAYDFVKKIRKTPILSKDVWGFFAARVQNTFILEGITMLQEGYSPAMIENLSMQAGMPRGALEWADAMSLKLAMSYEKQAAKHYGPKYIQHPAIDVIDKMLNELDRPSRKKKAGFWNYNEDEWKTNLWEGLGEHFPTTQTAFDRSEIIDRFLFVQVLEAIWCMQEGVITTTAEANLGSILAWGFPACKGGVIRFVHAYGKDKFIAKCNALEKLHGPRFKVPKYIEQL